MSLAAIMVHVDSERDCEPRIQLALALAEQFGVALIGIAGLALRPTFAAGGVAIYTDPTEQDRQQAAVRLEELGKVFCSRGQRLKTVEWRYAVDLPSDLLAREARAADLIILGPRHARGNLHDLVDPGAILLRAGRPVLVTPETVAPLPFRRVVVAWKDTRECRRAVRDALPLLQEAKEVLIVEFGDNEAEAQVKTSLADVNAYLVRHRVIASEEVWRRSRGPVATELLDLVRQERADLIVAGGYGHTRLGEWIFGGVTHELLARSPVCCLLSH
jgi:nucleotide-binding universal stress UspA family protein